KEQANNVSNLLIDKTKKGEVVALLLPNIPEMVFSYFGILGIGRIALLLSPSISDANLIFQIEKTRPKFIISQKKYQAKVRRTKLLKQLQFVDVKDIPPAKRTVYNKNVSEHNTASIIFTSGTTAEPKGVKLQHSNVVNATKNIIEFLKWNQHDVDVNILKLSHSFGLGNIHSVFAVGARTILFPDAINIKKVIQVIIKEKATTFAAVPTTLRLILTNYLEDFQKCDKYLRFIQTDISLLEKNLIKTIVSALPNTDFNYYYGLSEASRSTFITLNKHLDKLGSVGQPSPNVKLKIIDNQGQKLPAGQTGEICIKGKHVIRQYWENPKASTKIKNGWLHTNDAGYLDKEGYLFFKGRVDDIINIAGEKVSPEEIEDIVRRIPGVTDSIAIGIPDKLLGEAVKVFIRVKDQSFNIKKVKEICLKKLDNYKVPRTVEIVKEIPRTENGKLRRKVFKESFSR
ncbi:hypothetical protein A2160_02575, partial [Candidatus Beckwithbacteria bacterium RBG_13_42_9]